MGREWCNYKQNISVSWHAGVAQWDTSTCDDVARYVPQGVSRYFLYRFLKILRGDKHFSENIYTITSYKVHFIYLFQFTK